MTNYFMSLLIVVSFGCNNTGHNNRVKTSDLDILTPFGKNLAKMNDSLVIYETVCRGCAYEKSTYFELSDSMNLVKIVKTITPDNKLPDTEGGSIDKHIYLIPVKPGHTKIKLYKFNTETPTAQDSLNFTYYDIEIKK